jgi:hypothetical protein
MFVVGMNPLENRLNTAVSKFGPGAGIGLARGDLEESCETFSGTFVFGFEGEAVKVFEGLLPLR